jgi:hypothetical protein
VNAATEQLRIASALMTFADGVNIATNTTTGTKIGTATSQKPAFERYANSTTDNSCR